MGLRDAIGGWFGRAGGERTSSIGRVVIPDTAVWNANSVLVAPPLPIEVDSGYVRLSLASMRLAYDSKWFSRWYPLVYSTTTTTFGNQTVELPWVGGQSNIKNLDTGYLDRSIVVNEALTPLLPFRGGQIEIDAALVALEGENLLSDFVGVIGKFSALLPGSPLSAAVGMVGPLATSIQTLLTGKSGSNQGRINATFEGPLLRPGYVAVVAESSEAGGSLGVKDDMLVVVENGSPGAEYKGTHMLLHLAGRPDRDDWDDFTTVSTLFQKAVESIWQRQDEKASEYLIAAQSALATSPDLTFVSQTQAPRLLRARYDAMIKTRDETRTDAAPQSNVREGLGRVLAGA